MRISRKLCLLSLAFIFMNCTINASRKDVLKTVSGNTKDYSLHWEIIYDKVSLKLCLTSQYDNIEEIRSDTLVKKKDGYYSKNKGPKSLTGSEDYYLALTTKRDTFYMYKTPANENTCSIKKINNSLYTSTTVVKGMSNFKQVIFFNHDYHILKIETYLADEKFVSESQK